MPSRIVREAILSSERVCALAWPEEVFYRRLMSIVDDFGRVEANPQLLRSRCYPLQTDTVRAADITRWMAACQKAGLLLGYEVNGKQYLELLNFGQQQRSASKYPPPPASDGKCLQPPAGAHLGVFVSEVVSEGGKRAPALDPLQPDDVEDQVWADWKALRAKKRTTVSVTAVADARKEAEKAGISLNRFFVIWCRRGSQGLEASWLTPEERAEAASAQPWHETKSGVEKRAGELGIGPWDGGISEQWAAYKGRVMAAHQGRAH